MSETDPEHAAVGKQFSLLLDRLQRLDDATRERLRRSWTSALASESDAARTPVPEDRYIKKEFKLLLDRLRRLPPDDRARMQGRLMQALVDETLTVATPIGEVSFVAFGRAAAGRALTMLTKQPRTIAWIDGFRPGSVFWDIGANVGAFTLYAARRGDIRVVAFEPAAVNYFVLAANCEANQFDVECLLLGVGRDASVQRLEVSQFAPAQSFSFNGKREKPHAGRQSALVLSIDRLVEDYGLPCPNYLKIDVPALTEDIIAGGARTLRREDVREIHMEMRLSATGRRIEAALAGYGFTAVARDAHGSDDVTFRRK